MALPNIKEFGQTVGGLIEETLADQWMMARTHSNAGIAINELIGDTFPKVRETVHKVDEWAQNTLP